MSQKIDAIMNLSDLATSETESHILLFKNHASEVGETLYSTLLDIFWAKKNEFSAQFLHFTLNNVVKIITINSFVEYLSKSKLEDFLEKMMKLVIRVYEVKLRSVEYEKYLKSFDIILSKIIEKARSHEMVLIVLGLMIKLKASVPGSENFKIFGLSLKCLLRLNDSLDSIVMRLDMGEFFRLIYTYVNLPGHHDQMINVKEDVGCSVIRKYLYDICKIKGETILQAYSVLKEKNDTIING